MIFLRRPLSVRAKLLTLVLSPILVALPILIGLVLYWGNTYYDRLLVYKISSDLVIANQYLDRVLNTLGKDVGTLANSNRLAAAMSKQNGVHELLDQARTQMRFDFVFLLDRQGGILAASSASRLKENHTFWPVVKSALSGTAYTAIDIYSAEQLADIDAELKKRAHIPVISTPNAAPDSKTEETRGMVIHSSAPVYNLEGELIGAIEAGVLLNGNLDFVDTINNIVYKEGSLPLGSKGTATLFLEDVRIATNVRMFEGQRALGTRVSLAVRDKVMGEGKTWQDTAFVVTEWYVSGYEPLLDSFGRRVGMLYVGYLETPFRQAKQAALGIIIALFAAMSVLASVFSLRWARSIFSPLEKMRATMTEVESGNPAARVGTLASRDEIGQLAGHFDELLDNLQQKSAELRRFADELDRKVVERTAQLEAANRSLKDAQRQLVMSEKLAAIGQLTAGVAHEINNPIAVMQGNLDLIRAELGTALAPMAGEMRLLDEQVNRVRLIVTKLLQFARPDEYAGYVEDVDVNATLADCLLLVRHHLNRGNVEVQQRHGATRRVRISRTELQQVLINLMVNAIHAMPSGGVLALSTRDWEDRGVAISVRDTGEGIAPEYLSRIFDPFFTTKKSQGTGLGLSISYALVERYGGNITVESKPGQGAEFTVWLLGEPEFATA